MIITTSVLVNASVASLHRNAVPLSNPSRLTRAVHETCLSLFFALHLFRKRWSTLYFASRVNSPDWSSPVFDFARFRTVASFSISEGLLLSFFLQPNYVYN